MAIRFVDGGPTIDESDLAAVEGLWRIVVPPDYRAMLLAHNGGRPVPDEILLRVDGVEQAHRVHYFLAINDPIESVNLAWVLKVTQSIRPAHLLPFARDEGGRYFCLDLRSAEDGVYFLRPHASPAAKRAVPLNLTFGEFLEALAFAH